MKLRWPIILAVIGGAVAAIVVFDRDVLHFLGWDGQTSDNYAAWSGSVPAVVAMLGYSGVIVSVLHHVNCHQQGCWRIGRHKINGSPWCNAHHSQAREKTAATLEDVVARLDTLAALPASLDALTAELRAARPAPRTPAKPRTKSASAQQ